MKIISRTGLFIDTEHFIGLARLENISEPACGSTATVLGCTSFCEMYYVIMGWMVKWDGSVIESKKNEIRGQGGDNKNSLRVK